MSNREYKYYLINCLKSEHALWSFSEDSIASITDDQIIEKTLTYLDLKEIDQLFNLFGYNHVKRVWKERLIPQEDYLHTLNRFLAWYYFHAKQPDKYIKSLATRRINTLCKV